MAGRCRHLQFIRGDRPRTNGCEECLKLGDTWVHLRLCRTCGHVGCCDSSPNHHATKHFHKTHHPVIEGYDPPEGWGWCYVDETFLDLATTRRRRHRPTSPFSAGARGSSCCRSCSWKLPGEEGKWRRWKVRANARQRRRYRSAAGATRL